MINSNRVWIHYPACILPSHWIIQRKKDFINRSFQFSSQLQRQLCNITMDEIGSSSHMMRFYNSYYFCFIIKNYFPSFNQHTLTRVSDMGQLT